MRAPRSILGVLVFLFACTSATAGTLRCGSYLIQEGDDAFSVIDKCGEPTNRMTITQPVYAGSDSDGTHPTGVVANTELWRYNRGSGSFPALITIVDGFVQSIRFVR